MAKKKKTSTARSRRAAAGQRRDTGGMHKAPPRKKSSRCAERSRPVHSELPAPSGLEALLPQTTGRCESPWVEDLRRRWQAASPARRRQSRRLLGRVSDVSDPEQRLEMLQKALAVLGMERMEASRLVILLYYDWLVAGRSDVIGQIAQVLARTLADF